jgi:hypothetical protein
MNRLLVVISAVLVLCAQVFGNQDVEVHKPQSDERQASLFKAGDEWLALPEVFSNLDFSANSTFASEDDVEGQTALRATRFWGRLYIDGWPQTIQYFRAHFGIEAPLGRKQFVFAEPRDACERLTNSDFITSDHILLAHRGTCTFGTKAKIAQESGASAILIINNEPGLDHLPGPDAHDIQFSIGSIAQQEGQLLEAVYDDGPQEGGFGRKLEGYIVPINCEKSGARCNAATFEERAHISNLVEGGTLRVYRKGDNTPQAGKDYPIEYLLAHFGTKVLHENISLPIVVAKPAEACAPLENDVRGKIVLVRRGSCPFVKKSRRSTSCRRESYDCWKPTALYCAQWRGASMERIEHCYSCCNGFQACI